MKEKVQNRINQVLKLAKKPGAKNGEKVIHTLRTDDSLSKAIRTPGEATIFLAELKAAITIANKK